MPVTCFFCEPAGRAAQWLRRFVWSSQAGSQCSAEGNYGYHSAWVRIEDKAIEKDILICDDSVPHDDPRWPPRCACGYEFQAGDQWQVFPDRIYRRTDTGEEFPLRDAPVGAMWYADWMGSWKGPDGHCLVVKTPGGEWMPDAPPSGERGKSDARGWERTGTPPKVTARPSIGIPDEKGGYRYHAFLTDGVLQEC